MKNGKIKNKTRIMYYFAYGSNMSLEQMKERCGETNFEVIGSAIIEDYVLAFTRRSLQKWCNMGVADLKYNPGQKTFGVLYRINKFALEQLDIAEVYDENRNASENAYNRKMKVVNLIDFGKPQEAYCYFANPQADFIQPSRIYLDTLIKGVEENGLPTEAKEMIIEIGRYSNV